MPPVLITRSASTLRGVRKTTLSRKLAIGETSLIIILVVLISLTSMLYLVHSNKSATKGYELKILDLEHEELVQHNEVWNMRIAEAKAMRTILNSAVVNNMTKNGDIVFLDPTENEEGYN